MVSRITHQKGCGFIIAAGFLLPQYLNAFKCTANSRTAFEVYGQACV
jgi:hypothetical protein